MKRSPGLAALIPDLAGALAACADGPSAAAVNAWQSSRGGKDVTKVAQSLPAANQEILSGEHGGRACRSGTAFRAGLVWAVCLLKPRKDPLAGLARSSGPSRWQETWL